MIQNKILGIQQRIPLFVLKEALLAFISDGTVDVNNIKQMLQADYAGENRIKKTYNQVNSVITNSPLTPFIQEHGAQLADAVKSATDQPLILTALICGRYHFCYQVAKILAKQFRQQDIVSSQLLDKLISEIYGYNKSTQNSRNCAVPQLIEAGLIARPQPAMYEAVDPIAPVNQVTIDLWKEAFFANEPLFNRENEEDLFFEPFFRYIKLL